MRVTVIGAGSGLGSYVTREALDQGHEVTAFSRHPQRLGIQDSNLTYMAGDVRNPAEVKTAVGGADVVTITLGLPTLAAMGFGHNRTLSIGTANVVTAASEAGVNRIILETAIGAGESGAQLGALNRFSLRVVLHWLFQEKDRQEQLLRESGIPFVIVRPGALTNGPAKGQYEVLERTNWRRSGIFTQVSRADVAKFIIDQAQRDEFLGKAVIVSDRRSILDLPRWLANYRRRL